MHTSKGFPNPIDGFDDAAGLVSVRRYIFFEERVVGPRFDGQLSSSQKVKVDPACCLVQFIGEHVEAALGSRFLKRIHELKGQRAALFVRAQPHATRSGQLQNQVVFAIPGGFCIIRWSTKFK
jgi:hypothetical protein